MRTVALIGLALLAPLALHAQGEKLNKYGNPPKVTPAPTTAAITLAISRSASISSPTTPCRAARSAASGT